MSEQDYTAEDEQQDTETVEDDQEESQEEVEEEDSTESEEEQDSEAEKLKAENAKLRRLLKKKDPPKQTNQAELDEDIIEDVKSLKLSERKRQFGYEHGLSPEATDKVFSINPNPSKETLKDPFIQAGIKAIERQKKVSLNTPSSSAKAPTNSEAFHKKSDVERQQEFEKYMAKKLGK